MLRVRVMRVMRVLRVLRVLREQRRTYLMENVREGVVWLLV